MIKKIIIAISTFTVLFVLAYHNDFFYSKLKKIQFPLNYFVNLTDGVINEFNISRVISQKNLSSDDYIDLVLSGDDLKHISSSMKLFVDEGYIRDQLNPWRKAKVIINGKKEKIKFKFHGTSVAQLQDDMPFLFSVIMRKIGFIDTIKVSILPINSGAFSLKIKHKKKSNYYNLMRRYKLISHHDDAEISTIIINKIASKLGLMAPHGRMVILRVNGTEIGAYMLVEAHNKEWFEREHQLTNYTIFKTYDDWDRKWERTHQSGTELYIGDKKINTISQYSPVALGALELLLKAIRNSDVRQIKRMIDMDYMAEYMALLAITNNNQPITGDNLRYIYNHSTGRFKLLFRIEGAIILNTQNIDQFNHSLFAKANVNVKTYRLFKLLLTDPEFLIKRDLALHKIVQNDVKWSNLANETYLNNIEILKASNAPLRPVEYKINKFKQYFLNNIKKARQYLNYNKILVTKYVGIDGKHSLRIINDFTHPIFLKEIHRVNDKGELYIEKVNIHIKPSRIDINQNIIYQEQDVDIDTTNIEQLLFENSITNQNILPRHVYLNNAMERAVFSKDSTLQSLQDNHIDYLVDGVNKIITIQSGEYQVDNDIVTPYGFNVVIQADTTLLLNKGVSFLVRGGLDINGTRAQPVVISRRQKAFSFGVVAVVGDEIENTMVKINYLKFDGGSEAIVNGTLFTGQMSIINADVSIENSIFKNSSSDDGINIKYSKVDIRDSEFINNFGDQIDLDYCQAAVSNSVFSYKKTGQFKKEPSSTDGLDISGSRVYATNNTFSNLSDKGISIGEMSDIFIKNNAFNNNNLAIAVKDGSKAFVAKNKFKDNNVDVSMYIKKKIYIDPILYTLPSNKSLNFKVGNGSIFYSDNLNQEFGVLSE